MTNKTVGLVFVIQELVGFMPFFTHGFNTNLCSTKIRCMYCMSNSSLISIISLAYPNHTWVLISLQTPCPNARQLRQRPGIVLPQLSCLRPLSIPPSSPTASPFSPLPLLPLILSSPFPPSCHSVYWLHRRDQMKYYKCGNTTFSAASAAASSPDSCDCRGGFSAMAL